MVLGIAIVGHERWRRSIHKSCMLWEEMTSIKPTAVYWLVSNSNKAEIGKAFYKGKASTRVACYGKRPASSPMAVRQSRRNVKLE